MQQSHVISVSGRFAGVAIREAGRFRFHAIDPRADDMDGSTWPSLPDVQRVADHLLVTGRLPARPLIEGVDAGALPAA